MDEKDIDVVMCGLRGYVASVATEVGAGPGSWYAQLDASMDGYIALDERLPGFPGRDASLLWDERHGWALAVETHGGADFLVLGYLGVDPLPAPGRVAAYLRAALGGGGAGRCAPPCFDADLLAGLPGRLAGFTVEVIESPYPVGLSG